MKIQLLAAALLSVSSVLADWQPTPGSMLTEWGESLTPDNAWTEYPRPQMVRQGWTRLNGLWQFATTSNRSTRPPDEFDETILVPFVMESPLSGIGRRLEEGEVAWYRREFEHGEGGDETTLLHFEGVDYACRVWVNGREVGTHTGGNLPFSFDISGAVAAGRNELVVRVMDDTDSFDRYQLRGKQKRDNQGIWYTPSSGIWQTVWLETVPARHISWLKASADMNGRLELSAMLEGEALAVEALRATVSHEGEVIATETGSPQSLRMNAEGIVPWTPDNPRLYALQVELLDGGRVVDRVDSYVGFRTVGKVLDDNGHWRFTLNGKELFHLGPLDQGWWPDGLLNPPSDEAIVFEMEYLKQAGFNMLRKHKKVEPRRYYYHADRLGLLVWQDQVSGGAGGSEWPRWKRLESLSAEWAPRKDRPNHWRQPEDPVEALWPDWAHFQYMLELRTMIDTLYNHPSVVMWTAFNERWGQHRSMDIGRWVQQYDPTRYLNIASGGNFFEVGDVADQHKYPHPDFPLDVALYDDYVKVVGEYGGHGWRVESHQWKAQNEAWGYGGLPATIEEYRERYAESTRLLGDLKKKGIAAGVYTQTTDVEIEINGLMTYDRRVKKIPATELRRIHQESGLVP